MASTTFRFLKFGTSRQFFFQILCSKKNFENFFWSDQKTGLTARRVHYGPFRSPRSISGPYQKMTIPLLNSPKPHPLLSWILIGYYPISNKFHILIRSPNSEKRKRPLKVLKYSKNTMPQPGLRGGEEVFFSPQYFFFPSKSNTFSPASVTK